MQRPADLSLPGPQARCFVLPMLPNFSVLGLQRWASGSSSLFLFQQHSLFSSLFLFNRLFSFPAFFFFSRLFLFSPKAVNTERRRRLAEGDFTLQQALACLAKTIALHDLAATASTSRPHCRSAVHDMRRWVKRLHAEANKWMMVKGHGRLGVKSVSMAFNPEPHAGPLRDVAWLRDAACPFSSMTCSPLTCQNPGRCLAQYPPCAIPPKPPAAHDMSSNPSPNPPNPARAVVS